MALGVAVAAGAGATGAEAAGYGAGTLRLEVRVWQDVEDEQDIHVGARLADGSWRTLGMIPLALDDGVSSTGYRYGDITLDVAVPSWEPPVAVEVRVWQGVVHPGVIFISARPAGGSWLTLGTVRLLLDDGITSTGHRFGDISIEVPLPADGVTTLAGRPGERGYVDGPAGEALFARYSEDLDLGLAVDRDGSVVVADSSNGAIRRILPDGTVTTIAGGNGEGVRNGPTASAQFVEPKDVAIAPDGSIYVADSRAHRIRKIAPDGTVTTVAGGGPTGGRGSVVDGRASEARFDFPNGIVIDDYGDIYVTEYHQRIRRISPSGWVSTYVGSSGLGHRDGPASQARFFNLLSIDIDVHGSVYLIDDMPGTGVFVRKIDADGVVETLFQDAEAHDGGTLARPVGLAVADDGAIYIANTGRHQIVRLTSVGNLRAVAGTGAPGYTNGTLGTAAFNLPGAMALSDDGVLVVADEGNNVIRRIALGDSRLGPAGLQVAGAPEIPRVQGVTIEAFAGEQGYKSAEPRFADGSARTALFYRPWGMALDAAGNVVVADSRNHAIRRVAPDGTVTTIAGGNGEGVRDGSCGEARFARPQGVAVDEDGSIFIADSRGNRIRRISPDCTVTTVAGSEAGPGEDLGSSLGYQDGPAAQARFREPAALVFDRGGNLLIAERGNSRIRLLSPDGYVSTIAGAAPIPPEGWSQGNYGSRDGFAHTALFYSPDGIAIDSEGNIFFTAGNNAIRVLDQDGFVSTVIETPATRYGGALSALIAGIAVGADGALYVADSHYGRVVRVTRDGMLSIVAEGLSNPEGILALPGGALLVSASGDNVIWKITFGDEH